MAEFHTLWIPRRVVATVVLGLPAIVASAAVTGLLVSIVFDPSTSIVIALVIGAAITLLRMGAWTLLVAPRRVVASDTHLAVLNGSRTLAQMRWADMQSVRLARGGSLLRLLLDITSDDAEFPCVQAKPTDVWSLDGTFPPLLAVMPGEFRRLEISLRDACAARSVPFSVGS